MNKLFLFAASVLFLLSASFVFAGDSSSAAAPAISSSATPSAGTSGSAHATPSPSTGTAQARADISPRTAAVQKAKVAAPRAATDYSLVIIPQNTTLYVGDLQQFTVYLYQPNGSLSEISNSYLSWSTSGGIGTIDSTGMFVSTALGNGSVTADYIGPALTNMTSVSVSAEVQVVSNAPSLTSGSYYVLISPSYARIAVGSSQHFMAKLYDSNGTYMGHVLDSDLNWSSTNPSVGAIDSLGVFSALLSGSALVNVAYVGTNLTNVSSQGPANITVFSLASSNISSIALSPNPASLFVGQSQQFVATAYDASGTAIGVLPGSSLNWSSTFGAINTNGTFSATAPGAGTVSAAYNNAGISTLHANASVSVSQMAPSTGGSGSGSGNGGGSYQTSTTVSFSCVGKVGSVKITVFDSKLHNATVDIFYLGDARTKVFTQEISGTSEVSFTPKTAGDYELRVFAGADQSSARFSVPACGPQATNVTQNITVRLEPSRELVLSKLVNYAGGFSKRFSVYKTTDGQTESFESDVVLYFNYTGNSTKYSFDIIDSVPSSVLSRSSQITFADRPSVVSSAPNFEWHVQSIPKGGRLSYTYSFSRPLTAQMIALFDAPAIRSSEVVPAQAKPSSGQGLLAASIGPIFGLTLPLLGVVFAFLVLLALLYFFLFGKKKEDE
ncbi:MAG: hypothetical protein WCY41_06185 [Candidatus Micrarchaeia archaeon]